MKRAVFIDALGTILWMHAPWELAEPELLAGVPEDQVREAFVAEISYYRDHISEGRDPESLADLRERCAAVLSEGLGREVSVEQMLATLRFEPFDETRSALSELRDRGLSVVCVSNWDCSLPGVLEEIGLAPLFDGVVTSASAGALKPDPAIFEPALELVGCDPDAAVHVGDSPEDIEAAGAAGIDALLIDRAQEAGRGRIASLDEIVDHLR